GNGAENPAVGQRRDRQEARRGENLAGLADKLNDTAGPEFVMVPFLPISTACGPFPNSPNGRLSRIFCASSLRITCRRSRGKNTARNRPAIRPSVRPPANASSARRRITGG